MVVAKVVMADAGGDDQRVVGNFAVGQGHGLASGVNFFDLSHQDLGIFVAAQDGAQRRRNVSGRQAPGGDLVQQGLEKMEVALVDERDFHIGIFAQFFSGVQTAKSPADNNGVVRCLRFCLSCV